MTFARKDSISCWVKWKIYDNKSPGWLKDNDLQFILWECIYTIPQAILDFYTHIQARDRCVYEKFRLQRGGIEVAGETKHTIKAN